MSEMQGRVNEWAQTFCWGGEQVLKMHGGDMYPALCMYLTPVTRSHINEMINIMGYRKPFKILNKSQIQNNKNKQQQQSKIKKEARKAKKAQGEGRAGAGDGGMEMQEATGSPLRRVCSAGGAGTLRETAPAGFSQRRVACPLSHRSTREGPGWGPLSGVGEVSISSLFMSFILRVG